MNPQSVIVQVPASTSNCGPGYDVLSIALTLYAFVKITVDDITINSGKIQPATEDASGSQSLELVKKAAAAYEERAGIRVGGFRYEIWGEVPVARGLGSSATLLAGILAGLNALYGEPLSRTELLALCAKLDAAPDNSAASFLGGFCVSRTDPETGAYLDTIRFDVSNSLYMVVVSPDVEVLTSIAREALPTEFPHRDAVRSLNSLAYIVSIFAKGQYEKLSAAVTDYIHQPYRERLFPFVREIIDAGRAKGAYTGWLSGSGSSVLCVSSAENYLKVGNAMTEVLQANNIRSRLFHLRTDNEGLKVTTE